jgi:hypothetical protein
MVEGVDAGGGPPPEQTGAEKGSGTRTSRPAKAKQYRPSRDRSVTPGERRTEDRALRVLLTGLAEGRLIGDIAGRTGESPSTINTTLNQFREDNGLVRIPDDSSTTFYIRTVFRAIDEGYVSQGALPHPDTNPFTPPPNPTPEFNATIQYFNLINSNDPIEDRTAFNELEQTARQYIADHPELRFTNLVHAAAIWKSRQTPERPEVDKLTDYQLNALKKKARGYTDAKIAEILTTEEGHTNPLTEGAITTRLQYTYAKLGVFSNTEAIIKAMEADIIPPEFILEGHSDPDKLRQLVALRKGLAITLLEIIIADGGRAKTYEELGTNPAFTNARQVRRLIDSIRTVLGTTDVYHTTVVYAAAKKANLITPVLQ